jgi:hypothetical protein
MADPRDCTGVLTSLTGEAVLITGATFVDGVQTHRDRCLRMAALRGARPLAKFSGRVTLLVQGPTRADNVTDKVNNRSWKLIRTEATGAAGRHIHVVNSTGFSQLLHGERAQCLTASPATRRTPPNVVTPTDEFT